MITALAPVARAPAITNIITHQALMRALRFATSLTPSSLWTRSFNTNPTSDAITRTASTPPKTIQPCSVPIMVQFRSCTPQLLDRFLQTIQERLLGLGLA